jgi:hypothetical protein
MLNAFSLGNVNEKGDLENASLLGATDKNASKELASMLNDIGWKQYATAEDMIDDDDESIIPEQLKSSNVQYDFEDEDELAEEDDDIRPKQKSTAPITPVTQHDIEKQKEEEKFRLEQKQLFEQKKKELAQKQKQLQQQKQQRKRTSAFSEQYILYSDQYEGDVLRFTELFGPKEYQLPGAEPYLLLKKKKQRRRKKMLAKKKAGEAVEETNIKPEYYGTNLDQDYLDKEVLVSDAVRSRVDKHYQPEIETDDEADDEQSDEEVEATRSLRKQFDSEMFGLYPFDQIEWERGIRWGDDEIVSDVIDKTQGAPLSGDSKLPTAVERTVTVDDFHMLDFDEAPSNSSIPVNNPDLNVNLESILNAPSSSIITSAINEPSIVLPSKQSRKTYLWGITDDDIAREDDEEAELLAFRKLQLQESNGEAQREQAPSVQQPVMQPVMPMMPSDQEQAVGPDGKKPRKKYTRRKKKGADTDLAAATQGLKSNRHASGSNISTVGNKQLQHVFNEELLQCAWLDSVMWDPESKPKKPLNTTLILDLNDPDMLFEDVEEESDEEKKQIEKKQAEKENVNKYNVSIDAEYADASKMSGVATTTVGRRHVVKHSAIASRLDNVYYKTHLKEDELRRLHRPRMKFRRNQPMQFMYRTPKKEKRNKRKTKIIENKTELSGHDHRVILLEYIEQRPPMLNNAGMATKIINYYKKKDERSEVPKCDDGYPQLIDSQEQIPLLGPLKEDEFFTSMENQMYNAQIHKHTAPTTDFLLCTRKTSAGVKFYIRPIPMYYTAGHIQPQVEVPAPNSRPAINFTKNRLSLFIFRKFKEQRLKHRTMRLQIDDIKDAFPSMAETSIRKRLKEVAMFNRGGGDSGWWIAKPELVIPTENEMQALVTPEMVCLNESMMAGALRLEDAGVTQLASMASFASSHARLDDSGRIRDTIRFIERETINTPWTRTTNFLNTLSGKESASLQVLSVVIQNLKPEEIIRLSREVEAAVASEAESMLPTLTDPEARKLLLDSGENEDKVRNMTRTDRKLAARKLLEARNASGEAVVMSSIANKKDAKELARNAKFRQVLQQIFAKETFKLSRGIEYYRDLSEREYLTGSSGGADSARSPDAMEDDDDDDEDEEEFERDFQNLMQETKKAEQTEEDEERELQEMFKKGGLLSKSSTDGNSDSESESDSERSRRAPVRPPARSIDRGKGSEDQAPPEKKYYVKKTVMVRQNDGTKRPRVEIIRDSTLVAFYKQKKEVWEKQKNKKKGKRFFGGDQNDFFQSGSKEQRRLQDMFRRFKKMYDAQTLNNKKKKRRSTLAQTTYQATSATTEKRKEREEKQTLKKQARAQRDKDVKDTKKRPKKSSTARAADGTTKVKLADKPGGASATGLKINIPTSVVKNAENAKKRKAPATKPTANPAKRQKTAAATTTTTKVATPVTSRSPPLDDAGYSKPQVTRRRRTTTDQLADIFREVISQVKADTLNSVAFINPVDVKLFPDYRKIITHPMDLSTIERRINNLEYLDDKSFRKDFDRMIENARIYCQVKFPSVVLQAENLNQLFQRLMQQQEARINEIIASEGNTPASSLSATNSNAMFNSSVVNK